MPIPHCAGGPPDPALTVTGAKAKRPIGGPDSIISVKFNLNLDEASASSPGITC